MEIIAFNWRGCFISAFIILAVINGEEISQPKVMIKFDAEHIPADPLYTPISRFEFSERNTSAAYDLWSQTNITLVEWPGNITVLEPAWPLLKWEQTKAKLAKNQCNNNLGMHFYGYAYEYVHLTWGPFRITTSYCPPLKIPKHIFKGTPLESSDTSSLPANDFEFVSDTFLVIVNNQYVVRVGQLEAAFLEEGVLGHDRNSLSYSLATGLSHKINKLVTQACCTRELTCKHGRTVFAYGSYVNDFSIFVSFDGAKHFNELVMSKSVHLQTLIAYPQHHQLLIFYGEDDHSKNSKMGKYHLKTGKIESTNNTLSNIKGKLHAMRLGQEMSFLLWDNCHVWYSPDAGSSFKQGVFYYHTTIPRHLQSNPSERSETKQHVIQSHNCHLEDASVAYDRNGKIGLLDSMSTFFYGVDLKSSSKAFLDFPLVANSMDMTLMKKGTESSIVPNFDLNSRPKMWYPPKYLRCDHPAVNDEKFSTRLAVKLLPRTIFPSDFMPPFYEENIPKKFKNFGLQKCLTSGIRIDSSLTQIPQTFSTSTNPIKFQLEFKSFLNSTRQLHIDPESYKDYLQIKQKLIDHVQLGSRKYFQYKYTITITQKAQANLTVGDFVRLNFYTMKSLRCVHQPQQTVWIQVNNASDPRQHSPNTNKVLTDDKTTMNPAIFRIQPIHSTNSDHGHHGLRSNNIQECQSPTKYNEEKPDLQTEMLD